MKNADQLQRDVERELAGEPGLDESHIALSVKDGAVTIEGHVPTKSQKLHAVRAVERVSGVRAVADGLEIRAVCPHSRDDIDIAESIGNLLASHGANPRESVKATVAGGVVTLRGDVEWEFQRREAVRLARDVTGVRDVVNLIELKPSPAVEGRWFLEVCVDTYLGPTAGG